MNQDILDYRKGQRMGDIAMDIGLLALLGVGGYFAFKYLAGAFSSGKSQAQAANSATVQANTPTATAADVQAAQATGQKPTLSSTTLNSLANTIATGIYQGPDDADTVNNAYQAALSVNNSVDWALLLQAFATRQDYQNNTVDMVTGLKEILPASEMSNLTSFLSDQGIIQAGTSL